MSSATNKLNRSEVAESSYIPVYPDLLSPGDYDSQPATSHCSAVDILKEPSPELRNNQQRFFIDVENTNPKYDVCHLPVTTAAKIAGKNRGICQVIQYA